MDIPYHDFIWKVWFQNCIWICDLKSWLHIPNSPKSKIWDSKSWLLMLDVRSLSVPRERIILRVTSYYYCWRVDRCKIMCIWEFVIANIYWRNMKIYDLSMCCLGIFGYLVYKLWFAHLVRLYKNKETFDSFHNLWGFHVYEKKYTLKNPNCMSKWNFNFKSWFHIACPNGP